MTTAFVLINVEAKKEDDVYQILLNTDEIEGIRQVFGQYDIIARVEAKDLQELRQIIIDKIRNVQGVMSTNTLIISEE